MNLHGHKIVDYEYAYIYTYHTHTHTNIYIYLSIYIYISQTKSYHLFSQIHSDYMQQMHSKSQKMLTVVMYDLFILTIHGYKSSSSHSSTM